MLKDDAVRELETQVQDILQNFNDDHGALLAAHLAFKSRLNLYAYSPRNSLLIQAQNPYVTYVATYGKWKKEGANVLKGQRGLRILAPATATIFRPAGSHAWKKLRDATKQEKALVKAGRLPSETTTVFVQGHVFDISQTDFPKDQYPQRYHTGYPSDTHRQLYEGLKAYAQDRGITVDEWDLSTIKKRGDYTTGLKWIRVNHLLEDTEKLSTFAHELGHALLHEGKEEAPAHIEECEADAMGICIQSRLGLPLTDGRKRHFCQHLDACRQDPDFQLMDLLSNVGRRFAQEWPAMEQCVHQAMRPELVQTAANEPVVSGADWAPELT